MLPQSYKLSHGLCLKNFLQVWFIGNKKDHFFSFGGFQFYWVTKGFLTSINEQVEQSLSDHLDLNEFTTLLI